MVRRTILRTTFWLSVGEAVLLVSFAAVSVVVARRFGAAGLGEYSIAMTIGAIVQIVADAGYSIWLPREVAQEPNAITTYVEDAIGTKTLLWIAILPLALLVAAVHSPQVLALTGIVMLEALSGCISHTVLAALRGIEHYTVPQLISSGYGLIATLAMISALVLSGSLVVAIALLALVGMGRAVHLFTFLQRRINEQLDMGHMWSAMRPSRVLVELRDQWRLWWVNIASSIIHRLPLVMLGLRSNSVEVGHFAAAFRIYSAVRIVPGALFNAALPRLIAGQSIGDHSSNVSIIGAAIGAVIGVVLWFVAPLLIRATFAFDAAIELLQLLAIAFVGLSLKTTLEALLIARHQDRPVAIAVTVGALATVLLSWLLPPTALMFSLLSIGLEWALFLILALWFAVWRWH
ncbi:MAG: oligosaccharide flippase family protein [Chlorobi bacterium]|nr:oligosaccharide flippase family protein [Chlorobiota bacterium]